MCATMRWLGALGVALLTCAAQAQPPYGFTYPRFAPDACGPGYYAANPCGAVYGPVHCVYPGFPPWNGFHPSCQQQKQQQPRMLAFPTHPFARSPRDFFMMDP